MSRAEPECDRGERRDQSAGGTATVHFSDVDSPTDTRLALITYTWAGLRIVDLRDPLKPVEVGHYKPGDNCMTHVRYVAENGHIWFGCKESG